MKALAKLCVALPLIAAFPGAAAALEEDFVILRPGDFEWTDVPEFKGLQISMIEGRPDEPGFYLMRVKFPPGVMSSPHYHASDRFVTVISGTWYAGTGPAFERGRTEALPAGSFMKHPAGGIHYDGAKDGEVIVEISGIGPAITTFVEPPQTDK